MINKGIKGIANYFDKGYLAYLFFIGAFLVVSPTIRGAIASALFGLGWLLREMDTFERFTKVRLETRAMLRHDHLDYVLTIETDASMDEMQSWALSVMSRNTPPGEVGHWSFSAEKPDTP